MKPGKNHLTRKGTLTDFTWRYYERTVGTYLDLSTPLTASPDGKLGWRTRLVWRPGGDWWVRRLTWKLSPGSLRRSNLKWRRSDTIVLTLKELRAPSAWVTVAELCGDVVRERIVTGAVIGYEKPFRFFTDDRDDRTNELVEFEPSRPLPELHHDFSCVLAGCAEQGAFQPLVDWTVENVPEVASLFHQAGEL